MGASTPTAAAAPAMAPNVKQFVDGVITGIGAPVNSATETGMLWWLANEQGGPTLSSFSANQGNPLGVMDAAGQASGRSGNIQGGINATVANLLDGNYNGLVAAFRAGDSASAIATQIVASPWNKKRYGGLNTFLSKAGVAKNSSGMYLPVSQVGPIGAQGPVTSQGTPAVGGCADMGDVFSFGGALGVGGFSFTACERKALIGAMAMTAGGFLIVVGLITLVAGGKGGGIAGKVASTFTPVGRVASAVSGSGQQQQTDSSSSPTVPGAESESEAWADTQEDTGKRKAKNNRFTMYKTENRSG